MKVVLLAMSVRGAMGQYLDALGSSLRRRVDLHLFVPSHYDGDSDMVRIHRFRTGDSKVEALIRFLNPIAAYDVWQQIRSVAPDLLHLFNGDGYPWSPLIARWSRIEGIPLLVTVHDAEPHPGNFWEMMNSRLRRATLRWAAGVHIHAECFRRTLVREGISEQRIWVIPHGSLADRFLRHRRDQISRERLALFFGRLETYKGLDILVEAGLTMRGEIRVAIAGPGKLPRTLYKTIVAHPEIFELHNRYLSEADVARLFQRASVCVLPYRQATQSSVPLIAAAFGVPVVATAVGGFTEDVPRVNGLLVPPGSSCQLARGIREAMGRGVHYPSELQFGQLVERYVEMYRHAVEKEARRV